MCIHPFPLRLLRWWQNNPSGVINNREHSCAKDTLGAILGFSIVLRDTLTCSRQQSWIKPVTSELLEDHYGNEQKALRERRPLPSSSSSHILKLITVIWNITKMFWARAAPMTRWSCLHGWVDVVCVGVIDRRWRGVIHVGWVPTCWVWISCSKPVHRYTHTHAQKRLSICVLCVA